MWWLHIARWLCRQEGQDLTEYGLLVGLVVLLGIAAIRLMGTNISELWSDIASRVASALTVTP